MKRITWKRGIAMTLVMVLLLIVFTASLHGSNLNFRKNQAVSMAHAEGEQESVSAKPVEESSKQNEAPQVASNSPSAQKPEIGNITENVGNSIVQGGDSTHSDHGDVVVPQPSEILEGGSVDEGKESITGSAPEINIQLTSSLDEINDALPEDGEGEEPLLDIELEQEAVTYTFTAELPSTVFYDHGKEQQPSVVVSDGESILGEGIDYELKRPENSIGVGEYTILVSGLNQYAECAPITLRYRIVPPKQGDENPPREEVIDSFSAELSANSLYYTGEVQYPRVLVRDEEIVLIENEHYALELPKDSIADGEYAIVVTGINEYAECEPIELNYSIVLMQAKGMALPMPADLGSCDIEQVSNSATYNGQPQKPKYKITLNGEELEEGVDYEIVFKDGIDAIDADSYSVTIRGIGDFEGELSMDAFTIAPFDLGNAVVQPSAQVFWYTGNVIKPGFALFFGDGVSPIPSADYDAEYKNSIDVGVGYSALIVPTKNGNLSEENSFTYDIKQYILNAADAIYNGQAQTPNFTITLGDKELQEGVDYEIVIEDWTDAIDADSYPVIIRGLGAYVGQSKSETFTIAPFDLANAFVQPSAQVFWYTGNVIKPGFALFFEDGVSPIPSADYDAEYKNHIDVGVGYSARIVPTKNGNLIEEKLFTYDIKKYILKAADAIYNGQAQTPNFTITLGDEELQEGVDYEIVIEGGIDAIDADSYPVTIRGLGAYVGQSKSETFTIAPFDLGNAVVQPSAQVFWYTGNEIEPGFALFFEDGVSPIPSADYDAEYTNSIDVGVGYSARIVPTKNGNLSGEATFTYNIKQYVSPEALINPPNAEDGWYIGNNLAKLTAPDGHVFVHVAGVDMEDGKEYKIIDDTIYHEAGSSAQPYQAGEITIYYRLKCIEGDNYGALTAMMEKTIKQDTGFAGLSAGTITTRDASVCYQNTSGEKAYAMVYISGQAPDMRKWDATTLRSDWAQDNNAIENGNMQEYLLSSHVRATVYDGNTVTNYLPAGTEITVFARDYAGNVNNLKSLIVRPYRVKTLTISGPSDVARSGGEFLIQGEPHEVILLVHRTKDDFKCYVQLDEFGAAKVVINPAKGIFVADSKDKILNQMDGDIFLYDSATEHLLQQLTVRYADEENIIHKDGSPLGEASTSFLYHSKAFPILANPKLENRDLKIVITLPEAGTVTGIRANGVELLTSTGTLAGKGEAVTYDLHWANAPSLITAGAGALKIEYKDLGGEVGEGTFDIARSTVAEPVLMQIEPETNTNGYFGKKNMNIVIFGTSTEYEPISVHVGNSSILSATSTGAGGYVQTEKGNWSIPLSLSALPKNQEIVVTAAYRDVNGQKAEMIIKYDDECMPLIVVTTAYEGARYLAGITEPGAIVRVYCADETIKAKVDSEGYFLAELPMLFEGETIEIKAYDLAGNLQEMTLTVGDKPEPIKAHVKGKLFPQYDLDKIDWLQEKRVTREELEAGLVLPLLAGNLFPVGEVQVRLVNGEVEVGYTTLFPELEVRDEYFAIHTDKVDRVDVLSRRVQGLTPGTPVRLEEEADAYWIYASLQVVLTPEQMEEDLESYLVQEDR